MERELKHEFEKIESQIEKLATAVASSLAEMHQTQQVFRSEVSLSNVATQEELRSLRKQIE